MKSFLFSLFVCFISCTLFASDCYVDDTGDDSNSGTSWANAVLTMSKAITIATDPGDTIYIGEGTYSGADNVNQDMPNDVNVIGAGPTKTIFVLTGDEMALKGLEDNTNPDTLYTGFKVDASGRNTGWNDNGLLQFNKYRAELHTCNATISNVWLVGTYDGDQEAGIPGTPDCRNTKGIYLAAYGAGTIYEGTLTVTHCLFEKLGMGFALNDDYGLEGATGDPFAGPDYYVNIDYCTFVNCADTSSSPSGGASLFFRGWNTNRIFHVNYCVMSHCNTDNPTAAEKYGIWYEQGNSSLAVFFGDNLFYSPTIGKGANNLFGANTSAFDGMNNVDTTTEPVYVTDNGKRYALSISSGDTAYGWHVTEETGLPDILITDAPAGVGSSIENVTISGTSTNIAGDIRWNSSPGGANGSVPAALNWSISNIPVVPGTNTITISGTNIVGTVALDSVLVRRTASYYVSNDGDNTDDGKTPETAWETIGYAITNMGSYAELHILPGTYTDPGWQDAWLVAPHNVYIGGSEEQHIIGDSPTNTILVFTAGNGGVRLEQPNSSVRNISVISYDLISDGYPGHIGAIGCYWNQPGSYFSNVYAEVVNTPAVPAMGNSGPGTYTYYDCCLVSDGSNVMHSSSGSPNYTFNNCTFVGSTTGSILAAEINVMADACVFSGADILFDTDTDVTLNNCVLNNYNIEYNGIGTYTTANTYTMNPGFQTVEGHDYVAAAVFGKGWKLFSGADQNLGAPRVLTPVSVEPGATYVVYTNETIACTGVKLPLSDLHVNGTLISSASTYTGTTWSVNLPAPVTEADPPRVYEITLTGSPESPVTTIIIDMVPEPGLIGLIAIAAFVLVRRK